jgi:hypothetical protein
MPAYLTACLGKPEYFPEHAEMLDVILIFGYNANGEIGSDCK